MSKAPQAVAQLVVRYLNPRTPKSVTDRLCFSIPENPGTCRKGYTITSGRSSTGSSRSQGYGFLQGVVSLDCIR